MAKCLVITPYYIYFNDNFSNLAEDKNIFCDAIIEPLYLEDSWQSQNSVA